MVLDGRSFQRVVTVVILLLIITVTVPAHSDTTAGTSSTGPQPSVGSEDPFQKHSGPSGRSTSVDTATGEISVRLTVPNTSWGIRIQSIYRMEEELWIFSEVSSRGVGASVISEASDTVITEDPPDLPVNHKHYVYGKDWNWENTEDVTFIGYVDYYQLTLNTWWSGEQIEFRRTDSSGKES